MDDGWRWKENGIGIVCFFNVVVDWSISRSGLLMWNWIMNPFEWVDFEWIYREKKFMAYQIEIKLKRNSYRNKRALFIFCLKGMPYVRKSMFQSLMRFLHEGRFIHIFLRIVRLRLFNRFTKKNRTLELITCAWNLSAISLLNYFEKLHKHIEITYSASHFLVPAPHCHISGTYKN